MKKTMSFNWKMVLSIFMALMMTATVLVMPASAATSTKSMSNSRTVTVNVKTGSGWQYSLGWKKTAVTFTNTSKSGAIAVYTPLGTTYYLQKGRSVSFNVAGSGKYYKYGVQRSGIGTRSCRVTTSAGSVY